MNVGLNFMHLILVTKAFMTFENFHIFLAYIFIIFCL